jgi:hypothetical protein
MRALNKSIGCCKEHHNLAAGFTLVEVLLCITLLVGLFVGVISIYVYCFNLQETSRNIPIALNEAKTKLEEIKSLVYDLNDADYLANFESIVTDYNGEVLDLTTIDGKIMTETNYVTDISDPDNLSLIMARVVVCWRQKGGRIIGEAQIDGSGDLVFTDLDGDGRIESPVELVTAISCKK